MLKNEPREDVINRLVEFYGYSQEDAEISVDKLISAYGDVTRIDHKITAIDGLTQLQARQLLIDEMNFLIRERNKLNLQKGLPLKNIFSMKHLELAVFMARQRRGYDELLVASGFRAKKRRIR